MSNYRFTHTQCTCTVMHVQHYLHDGGEGVALGFAGGLLLESLITQPVQEGDDRVLNNTTGGGGGGGGGGYRMVKR